MNIQLQNLFEVLYQSTLWWGELSSSSDVFCYSWPTLVSRSFKFIDTPVIIVCNTKIIVKNMQPGALLRAIPHRSTVTTPIEKNIRNTLNASTFPGNILAINPPVFVCRRFSADPHRNAQAKDRGKDFISQQMNEVNAATSTIKVPIMASLNLQNFYANLFIKSPVMS